MCSFHGDLKDTWERWGVSKLISSRTPDKLEEIKDLDYKNTIYLSPDAEEVLQDFDIETTHFIIGGIVDRSVNKNLSFEKANKVGIRSFKLPITEVLDKSTKVVLNINTVFEMLLRYKNNGQDWVDSITSSMPKRHKII